MIVFKINFYSLINIFDAYLFHTFNLMSMLWPGQSDKNSGKHSEYIRLDK